MAILTDKNALATLAADDVLHVVDVSDTSGNPAGTSKKITVQQILDLAGGGLIQKATLTLNAIQIGNLNTSPQEIIPAPPAGKAIQVISAANDFTFGSLAFSGSTDMLLQATGTTSFQAKSQLSHTANTIQGFRMAFTGGANVIDIVENAALTLFVATSNPTGGTGCSSTVTVYYAIIDV